MNMNRQELQRDMIDAIVDGMDMEMLCSLACDALSTTYDDYSDSELMEEVKEYYPELLEKTDANCVHGYDHYAGCKSDAQYT
tara:strand:+ start:34 stop:279 length:246 start_codon:yes stop_codon:yes gene_type:complete